MATQTEENAWETIWSYPFAKRILQSLDLEDFFNLTKSSKKWQNVLYKKWYMRRPLKKALKYVRQTESVSAEVKNLWLDFFSESASKKASEFETKLGLYYYACLKAANPTYIEYTPEEMPVKDMAFFQKIMDSTPNGKDFGSRALITASYYEEQGSMIPAPIIPGMSKLVASDNTYKERSPLHWAVIFKQKAAIMALLEKMSSEELGQVDDHGNTALHLTVKYWNSSEMSEHNLNAQCHFGHQFANKSNLDLYEVVHTMIKKMSSEDVIKIDKHGVYQGRSALHWAVMYRQNEAIRALVERLTPEELGHVDDQGNTALHLVIKHWHAFNLSFNAENAFDWKSGFVDTVSMLIEKMTPSDLGKLDSEERSVLEMSANKAAVVPYFPWERNRDLVCNLENGIFIMISNCLIAKMNREDLEQIYVNKHKAEIYLEYLTRRYEKRAKRKWMDKKGNMYKWAPIWQRFPHDLKQYNICQYFPRLPDCAWKTPVVPPLKPKKLTGKEYWILKRECVSQNIKNYHGEMFYVLERPRPGANKEIRKYYKSDPRIQAQLADFRYHFRS